MRTLHTYSIPQPGDIAPGWTPPPMPEGWDEAPIEDGGNGPWEPQPEIYTGADPWDGQEPLFRTITVAGLTASEELAAAVAAQGSPQKHEVLCTQRALVLVDGRKVNRAKFEERSLWERCPPMVRDLWMFASRQHNQVTTEAAATFRASHVVTIES